MAMALQSTIEQCLYEGDNLSGFALDLSKAYNSIPRAVLFRIMSRVGFPQEVVHAYSCHLQGLKRFFQVADGLWRPTTSVVGVPEGCPLAVVSMILVSWVASISMFQATEIDISSYVDNWSLQHTDVDEALQAVQQVQKITQALQMTLAINKSFAHSTNIKHRRVLASSSFQGMRVQVVLDFKDLGVIFSAKAATSATGFKARFQAADGRLRRLQAAPWSTYKMARCLVRFVAPAIFLACEFSSVSWSTFRTVRARFNATMWGKSSARDHWLAPILGADQLYEPFFVCLLQRIRTFKRFWGLQSQKAVSVWNLALAKNLKMPKGPNVYFHAQCRMLGWNPLPDGYVQTESGLLHVLTTDTTTWKNVMQHDWCNLAVRNARPREGIQMPQTMDVLEMRKALRQGHYNSIAANVAVGAVFTSSQKQHFMLSDEAKCPQTAGKMIQCSTGCFVAPKFSLQGTTVRGTT